MPFSLGFPWFCLGQPGSCVKKKKNASMVYKEIIFISKYMTSMKRYFGKKNIISYREKHPSLQSNHSGKILGRKTFLEWDRCQKFSPFLSP